MAIKDRQRPPKMAQAGPRRLSKTGKGPPRWLKLVQDGYQGQAKASQDGLS